MNIVEEIRRRRHGAQTAILYGDQSLSFDSLFDFVETVSAQLQQLPVFADYPSPRIGVKYPNGLAYIILSLAVIDLGACFVPIPDELAEDEVSRLVKDTGLHAIISPWLDGPEIKFPEALGSAAIENCPGTPIAFPVADLEALSPAFIRFSSGTTAKSKGVVLSHKSLLERIVAGNCGLQIGPDDRVLWTLPMAHHFAVSIILYLYYGATTVLATSQDPNAMYEAATMSQATVLYGSPFHFAQLSQCRVAEKLPSLRLVVSTASALTQEVASAFHSKFGLPITQALGIIEVGLPILNKQHAHSHPTRLGEAQEAYEVQLKNTSVGDELLLRGPGMFDAYLIPWQTREQVMQGAWFETGDLVEATDDGSLIMKGRSKSVINIGGMKVFPEEIEAVLNRHPSIKCSRVFGAEHPALGAYPSAEIVTAEGQQQPSASEVKTFCASKLAAYKVPMLVKPIQAIELTASGKVKRY